MSDKNDRGKRITENIKARQKAGKKSKAKQRGVKKRKSSGVWDF